METYAMASRVYTLAALTLFLCAFASPSLAEPSHAFDDNYVAAKLMLGFGGSSSASKTVLGTEVEGDSDLGVSFGVAGQYMVPLHEYFALGGMLGITSWRSSAGADAGGSRNLVFDLAVVPEGKYAIMDKLELYATLPIGLAWDFLNEVNVRSAQYLPLLGLNAGSELDGGSALGFMIGFFVGARFLVTDSIGVFGELGYTHRSVSHTLEASSRIGMVSTTDEIPDVSLSFGQFALNLGVTF
jgi:hypothetical protein